MWFKDENGHPRKWMRAKRLKAGKAVEIRRDLLCACEAALDKLEASGDSFVMHVEPRFEIRGGVTQSYGLVSCVVLWCKSREAAMARVQFRSEFEAELAGWEDEDPANRKAERF